MTENETQSSNSATLVVTEANVPSRELRNDVSAVLRRVENGETLRITVSGRPVAQLTPLSARPRSISASTLFASLTDGAADSGLTNELADALPETTDDLP